MVLGSAEKSVGKGEEKDCWRGVGEGLRAVVVD
jgi:hypothetical protein